MAAAALIRKIAPALSKHMIWTEPEEAGQDRRSPLVIINALKGGHAKFGEDLDGSEIIDELQYLKSEALQVEDRELRASLTDLERSLRYEPEKVPDALVELILRLQGEPDPPAIEPPE